MKSLISEQISSEMHFIGRILRSQRSANYPHNWGCNRVVRCTSLCLPFQKFLDILSMLSRGSLHDKINWIFDLYDVNGDGVISKEDMVTVVKGIYLMLGSHTWPTVKESTIKDHSAKVFSVNCCFVHRAILPPGSMPASELGTMKTIIRSTG